MASSQQKIGITTATIVGMNAMIGAGIFSAPAALAGTNGIVAICTYLFVIATVWALALSISRVAQLYPEAGSFYTYASQWGGHIAGACAVTLYLLGLFIAMGLLTNIASGYLHDVIPWISPTYIAFGLLGLLTFLNIAGAQMSELGQTILIVCTVLPIVATTILCFIKADVSHINIPDTIALRDILQATKSVIFGFFGFESAASLYQLVYQPEKNVPKALTYSIMIVGIIYLAFITSIILATPAHVFTQTPLISDILYAIFPQQRMLIQLVNFATLSAIIGTLHAMLWSAGSLVRTTLPQIIPQFRISGTSSALFVGGTIAGAYSLIYDLDTYFSLTVIGVVSAYILALVALIVQPREWKNGQNIITSAGIVAAASMLFFAIQHLVS